MLINCVAYQNGVKLAEPSIEDISEYLKRPDCLIWVALRDATDAELDKMQEESGCTIWRSKMPGTATSAPRSSNTVIRCSWWCTW